MSTTASRSVLLRSLEAAVAASPYLRFLRVRAGEVGGAAVLVLAASEHHVGDGGRGSVHGGVLASFAEAAGRLHLLALGVASIVEPVDVTVDFLREATIIDTHAAVAVLRAGRRFATVRVDLWQNDPLRPVAAAQATYRLHHENRTTNP